MQLVYIYGPPGVGKFTVARELASLTGFKLFHIHLAVNLAASIFTHQSEPYFRLIRQIWRATFAGAVGQEVDLISTAVYRGRREHDDFISWMLEPIYKGGGAVAYVQLTCARDEWLRRVQEQSRRAMNKLVDPSAALALAGQVDLFVRLPFEPAVTVDNTELPPTLSQVGLLGASVCPRARTAEVWVLEQMWPASAAVRQSPLILRGAWRDRARLPNQDDDAR